MPAGHPPLYKTPEEMQPKIEEYFSICDAHEKIILSKLGFPMKCADPEPYTIAGLCYHLGYASHSALADLAHDRPEFSETVTRARLKIESQRSKNLVNPDTRNANGIKFDLTNNFGWRESSDLNIGGQKDNPIKININFV
jgi:DNA-packaging protein gp3